MAMNVWLVATLVLAMVCGSCALKERRLSSSYGRVGKQTQLQFFVWDIMAIITQKLNALRNLFPFSSFFTNDSVQTTTQPPTTTTTPRRVDSPSFKDLCEAAGFSFCPSNRRCYTPIRGLRLYQESLDDCRTLTIAGGRSDLPGVTELGPYEPITHNCISLAYGDYWRGNTDSNVCSDFRLLGINIVQLLETGDAQLCTVSTNTRSYFCEIMPSL